MFTKVRRNLYGDIFKLLTIYSISAYAFTWCLKIFKPEFELSTLIASFTISLPAFYLVADRYKMLNGISDENES